jgi:hypothetical protein
MARCAECFQNEHACTCGARLAALQQQSPAPQDGFIFTDTQGQRYLHGEVAAAGALVVLAIIGVLILVFGSLGQAG